MSIDIRVRTLLSELRGTRLVCVTKTVDPESINVAIGAGASIIGESRVHDLETKLDELLPCEKHLIGHLQRNKVKRALELFDVIQSIDSMRLLHDIDRKAKEIDKIQDVLLQVNIGDEEQKYGFRYEEMEVVLPETERLSNVRINGLMCIPPFLPPEQVRPYFRKMKNLFDDIKNRYSNSTTIDMKELSMGMSGDYRVAVEEGANVVRIGSSIFDE